MSDSSVIIDKYSKAAFAISKKANLGQVFVQDLTIFCQNIAPFLKELSNPTILKSELENIIKDFAKKLKINPDLENFLISLADFRRLSLVEKIRDKLEILVKEDNNILQVELISAQKLQEEELLQATEILVKKYSKNTIEIKEVIKEEILGGVIIKIGSSIIDSSVKNQLSSIYTECKSIINH